jgi:hypothetical protein
MNWAWQVPLPPTPKLVLMALADIANDAARAGPLMSRSPTSARCRSGRCVVSSRRCARRVSSASSHSSIGTAVAGAIYIASPFPRTPGQDDTGVANDDSSPWSAVTPPPVSAAKVTTTEPSVEASEPPPLPAFNAPHSNGGDNTTYVYPSGLTPEHTQALRAELGRLPSEVAQQILDELAGRMAGSRCAIRSDTALHSSSDTGPAPSPLSSD